jgi:hypothetical protein
MKILHSVDSVKIILRITAISKGQIVLLLLCIPICCMQALDFMEIRLRLKGATDYQGWETSEFLPLRQLSIS